MEAMGLGGCIAHCSPEISRTMEQSWSESIAAGLSMRSLFVATNEEIRPALGEPDGVGLGLDARRVLAAGTDLRIHTGVSHRDGASGWIGIGVAAAPLACFEAAVDALDAAKSPEVA